MDHSKVLNISIDDKEFANVIRKDCLAQNKELKENTIKNYPSQLKALLKRLGVKTINNALKKSTTEIKEALKDTAIGPRSAYVNALVAVCKACNIKTDIKFDEVKALNKELGNAKMEPMKENVGVIPANFDKKVADYLEKHKGSLNAVIIAIMALSPTVRGHMMEGAMIARGQEEYDKIKKENEHPVIGIIGDKYIFNYVAGNNTSRASAKVSGIQEETVYSEAVADQLKAYIKPGQEYLFPPKSGYGKYVSGKTFNDWVINAFTDADIPNTGVQKLRRIYETRISTNPTMSMAEKEKLSRQMNHSRIMGENYVIVPRSENQEIQKMLTQIGKEISDVFVALPSITDIEIIKRLQSRISDIHVMLKYESGVGTSASASASASITSSEMNSNNIPAPAAASAAPPVASRPITRSMTQLDRNISYINNINAQLGYTSAPPPVQADKKRSTRSVTDKTTLKK